MSEFHIRVCSSCEKPYDFLDLLRSESKYPTYLPSDICTQLKEININPSNMCKGCRMLFGSKQGPKEILKKKLIL